MGIGSIFLMRFILQSKLGLGLAAIRDNERSAASCGISVFKLKLYSFIIAAFVTGLSGAIYYLYQGYIEPGGTSIKMDHDTPPGHRHRRHKHGRRANHRNDGRCLLDFLLARYAGYSLLIQG